LPLVRFTQEPQISASAEPIPHCGGSGVAESLPDSLMQTALRHSLSLYSQSHQGHSSKELVREPGSATAKLFATYSFARRFAMTLNGW
jgi:hypothetical protein